MKKFGFFLLLILIGALIVGCSASEPETKEKEIDGEKIEVAGEEERSGTLWRNNSLGTSIYG